MRFAAFLVLVGGLLLVACRDVPSPAPGVSTGDSPAAGDSSPASSPTPTPFPPEPVPARYQAAWNELDAALSEFEKASPASSAPAAGVGAPAASLIIADGNRGTALLAPATLDATRLYLDRLREFGITGIELQVSFPLLQPDFPNHDRYLAYYRGVMGFARERGIEVLVETGPIFTNSQFTDVAVDFGKMTPAQYFAGRKQQIVTIATELRPDYIAIGTEPNNETAFAGIRFTNAEYVAFVNATVAAVQMALGPASDQVKLGVGTGTWEFDLFRDMVEGTSVDFHDIHIYPLTGKGGNQLQVARSMARLAAGRGRAAIIGESWLYKATAAEVRSNPGAATAEIFRRDAFSFWRPLEVRLIRAVLSIGSEFRSPLVSMWGGRFLFYQTEWSEDVDRLGYAETMAEIGPATYQAWVAGTLSRLGEEVKAMIAQR
ncbi:MAG: hypothetical protein DYG91_05135 [Chloroflexi bacterium CFX7]|nr:hypothetical protein [Chloroflexi bacterium CFX7]RIL02309.1 MAG: hypothetical protein DCC78_08165 [bacterium]